MRVKHFRKKQAQKNILFVTKHFSTINKSVRRKTAKPKYIGGGLSKYDRMTKSLCWYADNNKVKTLKSYKAHGINAVHCPKLFWQKESMQHTETPHFLKY
jgi:hypothetical protein